MRNEGALRMVVASYILAIAMPPVGAIMGILVATRLGQPYSKHWKWIILVCVVAGAIWAVIIGNGALSTNNNTGY
jgi:MFS family permease